MKHDYDLEIDKIISVIKEKSYKRVCLQFPDGLKPLAKEVTDKIRGETTAKVIIWAGSNFGACDLALEVQKLGVDLLIPFGHSEWVYDRDVVR